MALPIEPIPTTDGFWNQLGLQNPVSLFFPGRWISQDLDFLEQLRKLRSELKETLAGQSVPLVVDRYISTAEKRTLDMMYFNIDHVDTGRNPHLFAGQTISFPDGRPLAILFMGNAAFYEENRDLIEYYLCNGFKVLAFNYSGYGDSEGNSTQANLNEDAEAVYAFAKNLCSDNNRIFLHGFSIGGGVASSLAEKFPDLTVILDRSFAQIQEIVPNYLQKVGNSTLKKVLRLMKKIIVNTASKYVNYNNVKSLAKVRQVYAASSFDDTEMGSVSLDSLYHFCAEKTSLQQKRLFVPIGGEHNTSYLRARTYRITADLHLLKFQRRVMEDIHKNLKANIPIDPFFRPNFI